MAHAEPQTSTDTLPERVGPPSNAPLDKPVCPKCLRRELDRLVIEKGRPRQIAHGYCLCNWPPPLDAPRITTIGEPEPAATAAA